MAEEAEFIVNGYAFSKMPDGNYRVLNLNGRNAAVLSSDGTMLETDMDDIELGIVSDYLVKTLSILAA